MSAEDRWSDVLALVTQHGWQESRTMGYTAAEAVRDYEAEGFTTFQVTMRPADWLRERVKDVVFDQGWRPSQSPWSWFFAYPEVVFAFSSEADAVDFRLRLT